MCLSSCFADLVRRECGIIMDELIKSVLLAFEKSNGQMEGEDYKFAVEMLGSSLRKKAPFQLYILAFKKGEIITDTSETRVPPLNRCI